MFVYIKFSPDTTKTLLSYFHKNNQNMELLNNHTTVKSKHDTAHVTLDVQNEFHYKIYKENEISVTVIGHVVNNYGFAFVVIINDDIFGKKNQINNAKYLHITMMLNKVKPVYCRYMMEKYVGGLKETTDDVDFTKYDDPFVVNGKLFL